MSVTGNIVNAGAVNIAGFTSDSEKTAVVAADKIVILDSESSDELKTAQVGNIPGSGDVTGPSSATNNGVTRFDTTSGKIVQDSAATLDDNGTFNIPAGQTYNINGTPVGGGSTDDNIQFIIDGGGFAITTGIKFDVVVPFAGTITSATALADQSGSIVVDLWKDTYANYPPDNSDSITSSAPVTISTATKSQDSTLTGWTTAVSVGDIIRINVDSCTTITRCLIALAITKS